MSALDAPTTTPCACPKVEVRIQGELNVAAVPPMRERLQDALSLRPTHLHVDLSDCPSFDASGVMLLLDVHRQAWRQGASFQLLGCTAQHQRRLALMGLKDVFTLGQTDDRPCG